MKKIKPFSFFLLSGVFFLPISQTYAKIIEYPAYKDNKWEFTLPGGQGILINGVYNTNNDLYYLTTFYDDDFVYRGKRGEELKHIKLFEKENGKNYAVLSDKTRVAYNNNLYVATSKYPAGVAQAEELNVYQLTEQGQTAENILKIACHSTSHCDFSAPLAFSEKSNSLFTIRQDGDKGYLTKRSLGQGGSSSWDEIEFETAVNAAVISQDQRLMYLQGPARYYVVDLERGNIRYQNELPAGLAEQADKPLTLLADQNNTAYGGRGKTLFKVKLFDTAEPVKFEWLNALDRDIKGIAAHIKSDAIYVWSNSENSGYIWRVQKNSGSTQEPVKTDEIRNIVFDSDSDSEWGHILTSGRLNTSRTIAGITPRGKIENWRINYSRESTNLSADFITMKNQTLSFSVEHHVYNYDLQKILGFVDTGDYIQGTDLQMGNNVLTWSIDDSECCSDLEKGSVEIDSANNWWQNRYHWPLALALHVNNNSDYIRIGEKNAQGQIVPLASQYRNKIWMLNTMNSIGSNFSYEVTVQPDSTPRWKINGGQSAINSATDLPVGSNIEVVVTLPDNSEQSFTYKVTRGGRYSWPADLARFINTQAAQHNIPVRAGERLSGDSFSTPGSSYRNILWVPASGEYAIRYVIKK